jgi:hypothetical protein
LGKLQTGAALTVFKQDVSDSSEPDFGLASPYPSSSDVTAQELGLHRIQRCAVLVYFHAAKEQIGREVAEHLEGMNMLARNMAGFPISIHGVALMDTDIYARLEVTGPWLNIDRIPCLALNLQETELPLRKPIRSYMLFFMIVHENVDIGIKERIINKTPWRNEYRWWVEGFSNFCATQACTKYYRQALQFMKRRSLEALDRFSEPRINLLAHDTWYPAEHKDLRYVAHAYAASHYVFELLCKSYGYEWINQTFHLIKEQCDKQYSADFCEIAEDIIGEDIREMVQVVDTAAVREFIVSL